MPCAYYAIFSDISQGELLYSAIAELKELLAPEEKEMAIKKLKHIFKNILEEEFLERARRNPKSEGVTDLKLIQEIEPRMIFRLQTENGQPVAFRDGLEKQAWETAIAELKAEAAPDAALDVFLESVRKNNVPIAAPDTQTPEATLTDVECLQKLVDTGFITENTNIKTKTVYAKTRAVTVPKIYKELLKMTNDNERAERIMRNNISGVEAGLKQYLSRRNKK